MAARQLGLEQTAQFACVGLMEISREGGESQRYNTTLQLGAFAENH
jgi:hypothetical protein